VTIDVLPDDVLLETFEFYLGKDDAEQIHSSYSYDGWQTLVHVCHRWRCIVFASPCRLDLKLYCTRKRSKMLDIWPALPIVVVAMNMQSEEDVTNVIAALRHHNRVCKIYSSSRQFLGSLLEKFAAIDEPFSALTSLKLSTSYKDVPVLPDSFLGGSAPRLQSLDLEGFPYPSIGKLLSSTTNLVWLSLWNIPHSGYIAPKTIVPFLSTLSRLESLALGFQYPRSRAHQAGRHTPPLSHVVFPNLISLYFRGEIEYLEDILSQIETPMLNQSKFWFFNQLLFDTPLLGHFIRRTETFMTIHKAHVEFFCRAVEVTLFRREAMANNDREALRLQISCEPLDWQLSALVQVLNAFLPGLTTLENLEVGVSRYDEGETIEVNQWQEFLHPFTSVKDMRLNFRRSAQLVAPTLYGLSREGETELLPILQNLCLTVSNWKPLEVPGPVKEAIQQFIATRRLYGHPVTVHYK